MRLKREKKQSKKKKTKKGKKRLRSQSFLHSFNWVRHTPNLSLLGRKKQCACRMDFEMARMAEEEKENKKISVRVNGCCSCIHPSKHATSQFYGAARSLATLRHPGLHVIPYAANFKGVMLHCTVLYRLCGTVRTCRGTRADACVSYSNIGREPAASQPLIPLD